MSFDEEAKYWDNDPLKIERAKIFAEEISVFFKHKNQPDAMEFGCGTGLLSFELKKLFKSITLIDTSKNMIGVLEEKIKQQQIRNFNPLYGDLFDMQLPLSSFNVIYTLMTLHHITSLNQVLNKFCLLLKPGGYLCIADLVEEDGSFHSDIPGFNGHNGFDKDGLTDLLFSAGIEVKHYKVCYELQKESEDGEIKSYPLFLMIGKKIN